MKLHFCFLIFLVPNLFSLKFTRHIPPHHSITDSRNLSGTIPREIVLLKHLTYLDLGTLCCGDVYFGTFNYDYSTGILF